MAIKKITEEAKIQQLSSDASILVTQSEDGIERLRRIPFEQAVEQSSAFANLSKRQQITVVTNEEWQSIKVLIKKGEMYLVSDTTQTFIGVDDGVPIQLPTESFVTVKTTNEWLNNLDYVPARGEIVVYSDYTSVIESGITKNIPSIKIGDGTSAVRQLTFMNTTGTISKLSHSLTIGKHVYDGSADITVPIYDGDSN